MTVDEAIICLSDMKIKVAIPKAAVQARLNNDALNMAIEALKCSEIPNNSDTISRRAVAELLNDWLLCLNENCHKQSASDLKMIIKDFKNLPSVQPERKDAVEKAVAVEAICDELMSRFDVSATYGYDFAEAAVNRIEVMAKELEEGKQE